MKGIPKRKAHLALPMTSFFIPRILAHVRAVGGPAHVVERAFDLPPELPVDEHFTAPLHMSRDVADAVERLIDDPHLGLHLGTSQRRGVYGILEFAARSSPTLGAAVQRLARYQRLINNLVSFDAKLQGNELVVSHRILSDPLGSGRHGHEFTISLLQKMIRDVTREPVAPKIVRFAHARTSGIRELEEFFGTDRIEFDHGVNSLVFPAEISDMPLVSADPDLLDLMDDLAKRHLPAPRPSEENGERDCVVVVQHYALEALRKKVTPSIEQAAEAHHTSVRTLQRRLDERGVAFNKLVDEARRELSLEYLQDSRLRVTDVAARLGYSEVGPFTRAFRRWTGLTPGQYRVRR